MTRYPTPAFAVLLLVLPACDAPAADRTGPDRAVVACDTVAPPAAVTVRDLQAGWPAGAIAAAASIRPDADGALGRNRAGYFHVRFQMGMAALADAAVAANDRALGEAALGALAYGFNRTDANGDFPLVIPAGLSGQPTTADLASARAFFLSDAGSAALALENGIADTTWTSRLGPMRPAARRALDRLIRDSLVLARGDARAPNRLLFDALAYTALGRWLADDRALRVGEAFARQALDLQSEAGWFREGDGWDSSYQAVALARGWRIWALMPEGSTRDALGRAMHCGTRWLASRVDAEGTISTQGNTRVFDGGESFLGVPKAMAWADAVRALFDAGRATRDPSMTSLGSRVWSRYR